MALCYLPVMWLVIMKMARKCGVYLGPAPTKCWELEVVEKLMSLKDRVEIFYCEGEF
jgi:hypothetical protein